MKKALPRIALVVFALVALTYYIRHSNDPHVSAVHYGTLAKPSVITARDGGGSVIVGGHLVWLFGDTFYSPKAAAKTPAADMWRSATSSYASLSRPFAQLQQPADAYGNPIQVVPYTAEELAYNRQHDNPSNRYAVWPTGQVMNGAQSAWVFYQRLIVGQKGSDSTGIALLRAGDKQATRITDQLFTKREPQFRKALTKDGYVYLYAVECSNDRCPVARAPLAQAAQRNAYRFWDGTTWSGDIAKARPVMNVSNYGYSVAWNAYIGRYVSIMIGNLSNQAYVSYADQPQGPWSKPLKAFTLPGKTTYVPYLHPELDAGSTSYMTYSLDNGSIDIMKLQFTK